MALTVPWEIVISTAGGVAATVVGVFAGGVVGRRGQNEQWVRDNRTATYATFLREFVAVEIELRTAFLADRPHRLDWAPWNAALVALSLVATREVAAAAAELTSTVGRFAELVARSPKTREELREAQEALAAGQLRFVNAARVSLDGSQAPLDWQLGGPPAWAETEPYAPDSDVTA
ncbi:hypothetical protein ACGFZJ_41475 [Streptomyces sp. NPDC048253]|uniref:hypothetical protein n=1 Tax=Streptomyces sp. NPDC048253 TaxID=3365524 RepID=UPI003719BDA0